MGLYKQYFKCMGCGRVISHPEHPHKIRDDDIVEWIAKIASDPILFMSASKHLRREYSDMRETVPAVITHKCTKNKVGIAYLIAFERVDEETKEEIE